MCAGWIIWLEGEEGFQVALRLTRTRVGGLSYVGERAVDRFLGLVTVLPQQHKADLLLQVGRDEAVSYLPFHDVI